MFEVGDRVRLFKSDPFAPFARLHDEGEVTDTSPKFDDCVDVKLDSGHEQWVAIACLEKI